MLEIHKMLVLSTAHVSEATANQLPRGHADMEGDDDADGSDDIPSWGPTFARAEGWLFYIDASARFDDGPQDLAKLKRFAQRQGCQWLMLDRDGPTVDNLPIYEW